jgi:hypothetical protein
VFAGSLVSLRIRLFGRADQLVVGKSVEKREKRRISSGVFTQF